MMNLGGFCNKAMYQAHNDNVTMHEGALRTHPEFLLHNTDEYMATLL